MCPLAFKRLQMHSNAVGVFCFFKKNLTVGSCDTDDVRLISPFFSHVHAPSYPRSSPVLDIGAHQRIRNRDTFETRRDEMSRSDLHNSPWNSAKISTWLEPNPLQVEKAWLVVNYLTRPLHMSREAAIFGVQVEQASHRISWPTYLLLSVNLDMELGHYFSS